MKSLSENGLFARPLSTKKSSPSNKIAPPDIPHPYSGVPLTATDVPWFATSSAVILSNGKYAVRDSGFWPNRVPRFRQKERKNRIEYFKR